MDPQSLHGSRATVWAVAHRQHGVVTRRQLLELGLHPDAIKHRVARGRLYPLWRGVYAVGRPELTQRGRWMAAALACGPGAALSHTSGAAHRGITGEETPLIEVSVPAQRAPKRPGIRVHRRSVLTARDVTTCDGIPVMTPICILIDLAARQSPRQLEAMVNEATNRGLTDPETLRVELDQDRFKGRHGVPALRATLDRHTFTLTDSELERRFLPLARRAGLSRPQTQRHLNGFRVDFFWPELGLVVETDGLRYHRTPAQQARDRIRDQTHAAAGLTSLRFTHAQVRFQPGHVAGTLAAVGARLTADGPAPCV